MSCAYTCAHVTKLATISTNGHLCKHIYRVHSMLQSQAATITTKLIGCQCLHVDRGFSTDDEDNFDPLEYVKSTVPPQQGRYMQMQKSSNLNLHSIQTQH